MKPTTALIALLIAVFLAGPALADDCVGAASVNPVGSSSDNWLNIAPEGQRGVPEQEPYARAWHEGDRYRGSAVNSSEYAWQRVVPEGQNGVPEQDSYLTPTDREISVHERIAENSSGAPRDWQKVAAEGQRGVPEQEPFAGQC